MLVYRSNHVESFTFELVLCLKRRYPVQENYENKPLDEV